MTLAVVVSGRLEPSVAVVSKSRLCRLLNRKLTRSHCSRSGKVQLLGLLSISNILHYEHRTKAHRELLSWYFTVFIFTYENLPTWKFTCSIHATKVASKPGGRHNNTPSQTLHFKLVACLALVVERLRNRYHSGVLVDGEGNFVVKYREEHLWGKHEFTHSFEHTPRVFKTKSRLLAERNYFTRVSERPQQTNPVEFQPVENPFNVRD